MTKIFKPFAFAITVSAAATLLTEPQAFAQNTVSRDSIVRGLSAKPTNTTRSLAKRRAGPDARTRSLINDLARRKTRKIVVEERKKISKYVRESNAPSIDLVIYFDYDSAAIKPASYTTLAKLGQALSSAQLKTGAFLVAGHTDAAGSDQYNLGLSQRRAEAVRQFLRQNFGLNSAKLLAVGYGEEQLKNRSNPQADENRRVQVTNLLLK